MMLIKHWMQTKPDDIKKFIYKVRLYKNSFLHDKYYYEDFLFVIFVCNNIFVLVNLLNGGIIFLQV